MFTFPELPYAYNALEPFIDESTMRVHHAGHHAAYVKNLNGLLPDKTDADLPEIVTHPASPAIRNQAGGVLNHNFFWTIMAPAKSGGEPSPELKSALVDTFHSVEEFTGLFTETSTKLFGSGWTWLVKSKSSSGLSIVTTPNQDSPLAQGQIPLLTLDLWEHAYYLKYQNRRPEYIKNWWHVVNWAHVSELFTRVS